MFLAHARLKIMADKFTIGLVQMKCTANAEENLSRAIGKIHEAAARGAQIISLHELFLGEYFCRTEDAELFNLAEPVPGPTTEKLAPVAKEIDRKSTRLNSSHSQISYAVFCLKKKKQTAAARHPRDLPAPRGTLPPGPIPTTT